MSATDAGCGLIKLLLRVTFLGVAGPLLLVGTLLTNVAQDLELNSIRSFIYAAEQEAAAITFQSRADASIAAATVDQAKADALAAQAETLEGKAAAEGEAGSDEAGAGASGEAGEAGEAATGEAVGEAAGEEALGAEAGEAFAGHLGLAGPEAVEAAVQQAARTAISGLGAVGSAAASGAEAAGASAAVGEGVAVAAEGAAAGGGAVAGGSAVGTVAALGLATQVLVVKGPEIVAGVQNEFAAVGDEISAAKAEMGAAEAEAEAAELEGTVPLYEEGSLAAHRAAAGSFASAAGAVLTAQLVQLMALVFQAPVALAVATHKIVKLSCATVGGVTSAAKTTSSRGPIVFMSATFANSALVVALMANLALPWAKMVLFAATTEDQLDVLNKINQIPDLIRRSVPNKSNWTTQETHIAEQYHQAKQYNDEDDLGGVYKWHQAQSQTRRLFGWEDVQGWGEEIGEKVGEAGQAASEASSQALAQAQKASGQAFAQAGEASGHALAEAGQASEQALAKVEEASHKAEQASIKAIAKALAGKPNTATTTMAPLSVPDPPPLPGFWGFIAPGLRQIGSTAGFWTLTVLKDVGFLAAIFFLTEALCGIGEWMPSRRCRSCSVNGGTSGLSVTRTIVASSLRWWVRGCAGLATIWVTSIVFALQLRPLAEKVEASDTLGAEAECTICYLLAFICLSAFLSHAYVLGRQPKCPCCSGQYRDLAMESSPTGEELHVAAGGAANSDVEARPIDIPQNSWETSKGDASSSSNNNLRSTYDNGYNNSFGDSSNHLKPDFRTRAKAYLGVSYGVLLFVFTSLISSTSALLAAVEGPVFSWSIGSAWNSFWHTHWLLVAIPFDLIAPQAFGLKFPSPVPFVIVAAMGGAAVCFFLIAAKRADSTNIFTAATATRQQFQDLRETFAARRKGGAGSQLEKQSLLAAPEEGTLR